MELLDYIIWYSITLAAMIGAYVFGVGIGRQKIHDYVMRMSRDDEKWSALKSFLTEESKNEKVHDHYI